MFSATNPASMGDRGNTSSLYPSMNPAPARPSLGAPAPPVVNKPSSPLHSSSSSAARSTIAPIARANDESMVVDDRDSRSVTTTTTNASGAPRATVVDIKFDWDRGAHVFTPLFDMVNAHTDRSIQRLIAIENGQTSLIGAVARLADAVDVLGAKLIEQTQATAMMINAAPDSSGADVAAASAAVTPKPKAPKTKSKPAAVASGDAAASSDEVAATAPTPTSTGRKRVKESHDAVAQFTDESIEPLYGYGTIRQNLLLPINIASQNRDPAWSPTSSILYSQFFKTGDRVLLVSEETIAGHEHMQYMLPESTRKLMAGVAQGLTLDNVRAAMPNVKSNADNRRPTPKPARCLWVKAPQGVIQDTEFTGTFSPEGAKTGPAYAYPGIGVMANFDDSGHFRLFVVAAKHNDADPDNPKIVQLDKEKERRLFSGKNWFEFNPRGKFRVAAEASAEMDTLAHALLAMVAIEDPHTKRIVSLPVVTDYALDTMLLRWGETAHKEDKDGGGGKVIADQKRKKQSEKKKAAVAATAATTDDDNNDDDNNNSDVDDDDVDRRRKKPSTVGGSDTPSLIALSCVGPSGTAKRVGAIVVENPFAMNMIRLAKDDKEYNALRNRCLDKLCATTENSQRHDHEATMQTLALKAYKFMIMDEVQSGEQRQSWNERLTNFAQECNHFVSAIIFVSSLRYLIYFFCDTWREADHKSPKVCVHTCTQTMQPLFRVIQNGLNGGDYAIATPRIAGSPEMLLPPLPSGSYEPGCHRKNVCPDAWTKVITSSPERKPLGLSCMAAQHAHAVSVGDMETFVDMLMSWSNSKKPRPDSCGYYHAIAAFVTVLRHLLSGTVPAELIDDEFPEPVSAESVGVNPFDDDDE
jgi:hypothetical protein